MNAMDLRQAIDWLGADSSRQLTQALAHFLWQGCAIAILYAATERCLRRAPAGTRYLAGVAALLLMAACLPATLWMLPSPSADSAGTPHIEVAWASVPALPAVERPVAEQPARKSVSAIPPADADTADRTPITSVAVADDIPQADPLQPRVASALTWASPYASGLYVLGVFFMLLRVSLGLWGGRRLRQTCAPVRDGAIFETIGQQARRMGLRTAPAVAYCERIAVPVVVGMFRPMILLPAALATGLTPVQLQAVLLHELAHVRRYDLAVNVLQRFIEAFLFFHPAVWWLSRRVSAEREDACDDLAIRWHCAPTQYADALLRVAELHAVAGAVLPAASLAATGGNQRELKRRLLRLLGHDDKPSVRLTPTGVVLSALLMTCVVVAPVAWRSVTAQAGEGADATATCEVPPEAPSSVPTVPSAASTGPKPISMSAEEFRRLSTAEQRALLVRAFQRRIEHAKNIYFEEDVFIGSGDRLEAVGGRPYKWHTRLRCWRLGDSFRDDAETFDTVDSLTPFSRSSCANNAEEGVARNIDFSCKDKKPPQGLIQYPTSPIDDLGLARWLTHSPAPKDSGHAVEYLFPYLLEHQKEFEITTPVAGSFVQLSFPWQPNWAKQPGGNRVYLLDPSKGFLPVRCDSRYDDPPTAEHRMGRTEKFVVEESRLVGDVWMPTKLTEHVATSPDSVSNDIRVTVTKIRCGGVTLSDLFVPFPEGAVIQADILEGATYVVDAQGYASNVKFERSWWPMPPAGWSRHAPANPSDSWTSRILPADRERLEAARKAVYEKDDLQKKLSEAALKSMRSSAPLEERVEAGLKMLRVYNISSGRDYDEKPWASVVRELIQMGKAAVPQLCAELDRTERDMTLRALGFVLRGIGDRRAIPAMIRAIPRLLQPPRSDYGMLLNGDPQLAQFMQQHDNAHIGKSGGPASGSGNFSYGRPIREIMLTLEMMTGQSHGWNEINFVHLTGAPPQQRIQRTVFVAHAERWADWWAQNWRKYVATESEAQLDQTRQSLADWRTRLAKVPASSSPSHFPTGPKLIVDEGVWWSFIQSFDESPGDGFLDLDTSRHPNPPQDLLTKPAGSHAAGSLATPLSPDLIAWAEREGVDLVNVKINVPGGKTYYAFQPLGMRVWRIENRLADALQKDDHQGITIDLPAPWKGPLAQVDAKTRAYNGMNASYLFITREGTCGLLQLLAPLSTKPVYGSACMGGGGLKYKPIYEGDAEAKPR
jgi:beta-lactamase regulating signal transducer with metallopeptidase domain